MPIDHDAAIDKFIDILESMVDNIRVAAMDMEGYTASDFDDRVEEVLQILNELTDEWNNTPELAAAVFKMASQAALAIRTQV